MGLVYLMKKHIVLEDLIHQLSIFAKKLIYIKELRTHCFIYVNVRNLYTENDVESIGLRLKNRTALLKVRMALVDAIFPTA